MLLIKEEDKRYVIEEEKTSQIEKNGKIHSLECMYINSKENTHETSFLKNCKKKPKLCFLKIEI